MQRQPVEIVTRPANVKNGHKIYQIRGISTVGRTSLPYCRPSGTLVNQGNPFKMKGNVTRPADVKRGKLPRKTSGNPYGALAQLVARDIRIVEVRGSTPLCSTKTLQINVCKVFSCSFCKNLTMQILHGNRPFCGICIKKMSVIRCGTLPARMRHAWHIIKSDKPIFGLSLMLSVSGECHDLCFRCLIFVSFVSGG